MQNDRIEPKAANAIRVVLEHEGGYVVDHAGPTNFGITLNSLQEADLDLDFDGDTDKQDVQLLNEDTAIDYYYHHWYLKHEYGRIHDWGICAKVLDLSVNMGSRQTGRIVQRAVRACGQKLVEDGIIGPKTFEAINQTQPVALLPALRSEAAGFYRLLANQKPTKYGGYLNGWLNRAYD